MSNNRFFTVPVAMGRKKSSSSTTNSVNSSVDPSNKSEESSDNVGLKPQKLKATNHGENYREILKRREKIGCCRKILAWLNAIACFFIWKTKRKFKSRIT